MTEAAKIKPNACIDIHTHFVPRELPRNPLPDKFDQWPGMKCGQCGRRTFYAGEQAFRDLNPNTWSPLERIGEMNETGIGLQVLSPMPELLGYWLEPAQTAVVADYVNTELGKVVSAHPTRFTGFGMATMQDPSMAAREISLFRKEFGLIGVEIGSHINGVPLGDPRFDEFFAAAEENNLAVFVHALHPPLDRLPALPLMDALLAFPQEGAHAGVALMIGNVLHRYPDLHLALSHGGGTLPWIAGRLRNGWSCSDAMRQAIPMDPMEFLQNLWFDSLVYEPKVLTALLELVGTDRVMIGTDYPFLIQEPDPIGFLQRCQLNQETLDLIQTKNAQQFLRL